MAKAAIATRDNPVSGMKFANSCVTLETAPPAARVSLRATARGATDYGKKIGIELPTKPGLSNSKSGLSALWIGPDEWLIIDEKNDVSKLIPTRKSAQISVTDISHRNVAFLLSGEGAANTLSSGAPRDLSLDAFPVGCTSRTILGKTEIVLLRTGKTSFRLECWRSFAPYVWELLCDGAKDAHI